MDPPTARFSDSITKQKNPRKFPEPASKNDARHIALSSSNTDYLMPYMTSFFDAMSGVKKLMHSHPVKRTGMAKLGNNLLDSQDKTSFFLNYHEPIIGKPMVR